MEKHNRPDLENEMDELQRVVQDLSRDEDITVSVDELVKVFKNAEEVTLSDEIWSNLENTESNEIERGDMDSVMDIAKTYKKTNPKKLAQVIKSGDYKRPLILKFGDRYHLVAGNTRLCTAAAMGVNPKVFIGTIDNINETEKLKGGLSDKKTLEDIAKKHDSKGYYHIVNMVQSLKKQLDIGVKIEMEHTNNKDEAMEIALDHLWENPKYYSKLKKSNIDENCWKGYKRIGSKVKNGKSVPNCVPTNEASSPAQQAAIAINMKKKGIKPKNESVEVNGNKKIDKDLGDNQQDMVYGIVDIIKKIEDIENRKKIANDMVKKFKEENIKFDYSEFLDMCGIKSKIETKESTDAGSSGSFSGPAFGGGITKREIYKIHNAKLHEEVEMGEATDASSSGSYDVPLFGKTPKGNRNPLKIDGPDSIYKGRAVKDKKFPKYGGPNGVYVKIKEKCKKFPYCNQGNTGALEFIKEDSEIKEAINEISKKYGIPRNEVEKIVLNDINQIFI